MSNLFIGVLMGAGVFILTTLYCIYALEWKGRPA